MNFGTFVATNYDIKNNSLGKHQISNKEVSLTFLNARQVADTYKIEFAVSISFQSFDNGELSRRLSASNIDMKSLENAIWSNIDSYDKDFLILKDFSTNKATFYFDYDKWFKDSISNSSSNLSMVKFSKEISFSKRVPKIIMYDIMRENFSGFLENRFKKYVIDKKLDQKWFRNLMKDRKFRSKIANLFNYDYDIQFNKITMSLKPQYVMMFLFGLSKLTKNTDISYNDFEKEFENKTRRKISIKERDKYKKFIKNGKIF